MLKQLEYCGMKYDCFDFNSLAEFNNYLNSHIEDKESLERSISFNKSFFGISSLEEHNEYIKKGYKKSIEVLKKGVAMASKCFDTGDRKRLVQTNSYCGCKPNISRYVLGLPNNMVRLATKRTTEKKVLNFLYDLGIPYSVTSESATEKFSEIFKKIYACCLKGYKVRISLLVGTFPVNSSVKPIILKIPVKKETDVLNLSKLSYALMNVGYFRTEIVLKFIENFLHIYEAKGFYSKNSEFRNGLINQVLPHNETGIYLNYQSDIETIFSKL